MQYSSHHRCQPCHVISLICARNVWCYHTYVQPYPCPRHSMGNPSQFHTSTLRHTCGCIAVLCPQRKTNWINIDRARDHCQWEALTWGTPTPYSMQYALSSPHTITLESLLVSTFTLDSNIVLQYYEVEFFVVLFLSWQCVFVVFFSPSLFMSACKAWR